MLNEDPDKTIKTLCLMDNVAVTWNTYKKTFEEKFNEGKKISNQHNDAHFYLLTQLGFLTKLETSEFRISSTGKLFCKLINNPENEVKFQKMLGALLKNNTSKGHWFRQFLDFVKTPKNNKELKMKFPGESYRTLKKWLVRANLVTIQGDFCASTPSHHETKYSLKKFWDVLLCTYKEMQQMSPFSSHRYYIQIGELRQRISCELGFNDQSIFDQYLIQILEDKKYRLKTRVHGAPTHAYDELNFVS